MLSSINPSSLNECTVQKGQTEIQITKIKFTGTRTPLLQVTMLRIHDFHLQCSLYGRNNSYVMFSCYRINEPLAAIYSWNITWYWMCYCNLHYYPAHLLLLPLLPDVWQMFHQMWVFIRLCSMTFSLVSLQQCSGVCACLCESRNL